MVHACHHAYARETGIIYEILEAERAANHESINENGWMNSVVDMVLYDLIQRTPGLTLHLNTSVNGVLMEGSNNNVYMGPLTAPGYYERPACNVSRRIAALTAQTLSAECDYVLSAPLFVDATGDGLLADLAGCAWRMGSESRSETGEQHAPLRASMDTMGNSIHIRARDMGRPSPFTAPAWAVQYQDPAFFMSKAGCLMIPEMAIGGSKLVSLGIPSMTTSEYVMN